MFAIKSCVQKVRACTRRTAGVLGKLFAEFHCGSLRGVTFCANRKSPKSRTGRGFFDSPSPCEPSPATTEVGLRSPFWNPLRLVQWLTLPASIFAKTNLVQKTALDSRSFAILWRESKGNRARFLFGGSRVGFQKGRGNRNPRPFCDSLHTFCSHRKYARGATGSATLRKTVSQTLQCPVHGAPPHLPIKNAKPASVQNRSRLVILTSPVLYPAFSPS